MDFITPQGRQQISFNSLEDKIQTDNPVRFVEAFVEHLIHNRDKIQYRKRKYF